MRVLPFAVIALFVLYTLAWVRSDPTFDYPAFYSAGRLVRANQNAYDLNGQCAVQSQVSDRGCLPFAHPPLLLPLMAVTAVDNFRLAHRLYGLAMIGLFVISFFPLRAITGDRLKAAVLLTFLPVQQAIYSTQSTPLLLLGVLLWVLFLQKQRDLLAGLCLTLAWVKPHIAIALAVPLLFSRPKVFLGFLIGALAVFAYSLFLVGPSGIRGMLDITLLMSKGDGFYINRDRMPNLAGFITRAGYPEWLIWLGYGLGMCAVSFLWRRLGTSLPKLGIGTGIITFTSPHLHLHDLCLLIVPLLTLPVLTSLFASTLIVATLLLGSYEARSLFLTLFVIQAGLVVWVSRLKDP